MASVPLFFMSSAALFCINFNFINRVLWVPLFNILTMANPEISSINGAFTFISFCLLAKIVEFSVNMVYRSVQKFETTVPRVYYTF